MVTVVIAFKPSIIDSNLKPLHLWFIIDKNNLLGLDV